MVVYSHGYLDHRSGDDQFRALPDVEVVPTDLESVKGRLGIADWQTVSARLTLATV